MRHSASMSSVVILHTSSSINHQNIQLSETGICEYHPTRNATSTNSHLPLGPSTVWPWPVSWFWTWPGSGDPSFWTGGDPSFWVGGGSSFWVGGGSSFCEKNRLPGNKENCTVSEQSKPECNKLNFHKFDANLTVNEILHKNIIK